MYERLYEARLHENNLLDVTAAYLESTTIDVTFFIEKCIEYLCI
jgi:hypothetical protein